MPSFAQTIVLSIATLMATVSATPVDLKNLDARDVNVCWGPGSKGTDGGRGPTPSRCLQVHYENAFTAPFVIAKPGAPPFEIVTASHQTFGPMHCCHTCTLADNCIGWQITADCECVLWKAPNLAGASEVLGLWAEDGPYINKTGSFHRGPAFPPAPNFFGNALITAPQAL
ncbi:hypothetical protein TWF730_007326 [Orbilia blumenaviensis]|uniref:Uncharacterized protein n=1 Tax=Orbilia blumenaviensis TaxID=1796055 RepID=A0AAV9VA16_9PEZI